MVSNRLKEALIWMVRINKNRRRFYVSRSVRTAKLIRERNVYNIAYDFDIDVFTPCETLLLAMTRKLYTIARHKVTTLAQEEGLHVMWDSNNAPVLLRHVAVIDAMTAERKRVDHVEMSTKSRYLQIRKQELEQEFPDIKVRDIVGYEE